LIFSFVSVFQKLSTFVLVLSIWGIVQLAITGVLFHNRSVALIEDIFLEDGYKTKDQLINDINIRYDTSALNCWIAALMYIATLCISAQQFWSHGKTLDINAEM
jgi:ribonuclease kappa